MVGHNVPVVPLQPAVSRENPGLLRAFIAWGGFPRRATVIQFCVKALLCQELGMVLCSTICPSFTAKMVSHLVRKAVGNPKLVSLHELVAHLDEGSVRVSTELVASSGSEWRDARTARAMVSSWR